MFSKRENLVAVLLGAGVLFFSGTLRGQVGDSVTFVGPTSYSHLGERTSPFEPPEASDRVFVLDQGPGLDSGCLFRTDGPLVFQVEIDRYVGELNGDGTLKDAEWLIYAGLLSEVTRLSLPVYDVDSEDPGWPFAPEIDRIFINDYELGVLEGNNRTWHLNRIEVPTSVIRFAEKGSGGSGTTPGVNEVRIEIDTDNVGINEEVWCSAFDWVSLEFKAMSPVILVHGNDSDPGFFDRQGFVDSFRRLGVLVDGCESCDSPLDLPANDTEWNASELRKEIPKIVRDYGVDSVHLVAHSKGGLDTREYLVRYQPFLDEDFNVLSLTTLSSPHNGSVGADVLVVRDDLSKVVDRIRFVGFPSFTDVLTAFMGISPGHRSLTTWHAAWFNLENLPQLPRQTRYHTVSADADQNESESIDLRSELAGMEHEESMMAYFNDWFATGLVNHVYQTLRQTKAVEVEVHCEPKLISNGDVARRFCEGVIIAVPGETPQGNDALVTIPSGHGSGGYSSFTSNNATFRGPLGRNHASIADDRVASQVIPWLWEVDRQLGDLQ